MNHKFTTVQFKSLGPGSRVDVINIFLIHKLYEVECQHSSDVMDSSITHSHYKKHLEDFGCIHSIKLCI